MEKVNLRDPRSSDGLKIRNVIGASGLKLHWAWNGIAMGLAVGSEFSYFLFMTLGASMFPVGNFLMNGVFGLGIEFFTTVVFKHAAAERAQAPPKPAMV